MAQGDPQGWEVLSSSDPIRYQAVLRLNRSQGAGQTKQSVRVITNRSNGNYDVYTTAFGSSDQLIYSYNTSNNKTTVSNQAIYDQIFTGPRSNQLNNLNSEVRKSTLQLAENNISGGPNSISSRDLQQLKNSQGYKSLSNAVPAPTPPAPTSDPPLAPGPGADPTPTLSTFQPELGEGVAVTEYNTNQSAISKKYSSLVYPRDHGDSPYDFIQIIPIEYVPGFGLGTYGANLTVERVRNRFNSSGQNQRYKQTGTQIFLPMTPGISETNSVGWGSDELNPIQALFGQTAYDAISGAANEDLLQALTDLGDGLTKAGQTLLNTPKLTNLISSYFAGKAVGANLLGRSGIVINPNLELLFQGPKLRSFRYNFRFTPRDDDEAKIVRTIIKVFKKTMAVRQSTGSLFLGVPSVYELKYIYNSGGDHPFLNKIKPCALTAFNVNYTPDGSYMTYQDGSMTSYTVDMQFDEIEPIYNEDIDDIDGPTTGY